MNYVTPESVGISSANILEMVKRFEEAGLNMHDVIIARRGEVCFEAYWKPFDENFAHRMYSVTKSFVAIAVGFLVQDGLVSIDDKIIKYFPEEEELCADENIKLQSIRDMLMMASARGDEFWFTEKPEDRVKYYFETPPKQSKTPGTLYRYDSNGSFILGAMVERISKKSLLEFLREKLFDKIGISDNVECLKCPGGHSWGDSAFIMPAQDLLKFAMFVMNNGSFNGEQILDADYVKAATSKQVDNSFMGNNSHNNQGYGYQIWRTYDNSFAFFGMGCQFAICVPDKDLVFVCNADNQGIDYASKFIFEMFFRLISRRAEDVLPENKEAQKALAEYTDSLKLSVAKGEKYCEYQDVINGKTFMLQENPMGIKQVTLNFCENRGSLKYINEQGEKEILFGMKENVYGMFPQTGYANEYATIDCPGHMYKYAASAGWIEEKKLYIKLQIIDKYFGNLHIIAGFNKDGKLGLSMQKFAEDFMEEYNGYAAEVL